MTKQNKLLLVDDEQDIITTTKAGLERLGFSVDGFTDPRKALDNYKPDYYSRIIADIRMPDMNGFELAREIWAQDPDAQVCFLSAFEIYKEEAHKVFANLKSDCFIKKPLTPSALAAHLLNHSVKG